MAQTAAHAGPTGAAPSVGAAAAAGGAAAALDGKQWATLIERLARNLDRGGKQWTLAQRKYALQRVLAGSRSEATLLHQRLHALMAVWEADRPDGSADPIGLDDPVTAAAIAALPAAAQPASQAAAPTAAPTAWLSIVGDLQRSVRAGLPAHDVRALAIADQLAAVADALARDGATAPHAATVAALCEEARSLFGHRNRLVEQLSALCRELSQGLTELAEDDSWVRGQAARIHDSLVAEAGGEPSLRSVRAASVLLEQTRRQQHGLRAQRQAARESIKVLIQRMIGGVGEIGEEADRFQQAVGAHAEAVARADNLESLGTVVRAILDDSQAVQTAVRRTQQKLEQERVQAETLEGKVRELEGELRRLSDEVATDALTQVANRRGLNVAFEAERARCERAIAAGSGEPGLAVALIDIDNFKKLNDTLGHAVGDVALKSLATAVRERLRPVDHLARFGGEEFVVLLPATASAAAQQTLTRLQRELSAALFMHEGRDVLITFSAGVTQWRPGEAMESAIERADEALYEAKRTGKNRTCVA